MRLKKRGNVGRILVVLLSVLFLSFLLVFVVAKQGFTGYSIKENSEGIEQINGLQITRGKAKYIDPELDIEEKQISILLNKKSSENKEEKYKVIITMKDPGEIEGWKKQVSLMNKKASKELRKKMRAYPIKQMNNNSLGHKYNSFNGFSAELTKEELERLSENSLIKRIDKDGEVHAFLQDSTNIINATSTWDLNVQGQNITGKGETVCIIDTGTDYTHSDLGNCTTSEFLNGNCEKVVGGWDFVNNDADPMDDNHHGTHVSGIAAANGNIKGVSPNSKIYSIKSLDFDGGGSSSDVILGIENCTNASEEYNISVISMSLGGSENYSDYCDGAWGGGVTSAINEAVSNNITVTVASGNYGNSDKINPPACIKNATAIGSSTDEDNIASHSNLWDLKMLVAPGSNINSTYPGDSYNSISGTSMATPHVAGAVALLQNYKKLVGKPELTVSEIESVLNDTGKLIYDSGSGRNYSRIDVLSAIESFFHEVNLISPVNGTISGNDTQNFVCNVSGDSVLNNIALYLWNNNDSIFYNYSEDITGGKNNYILNHSINNISKGEYKWNCNSCDNKSICVYSEKNYSIILNSPPVFNYSKNITSPLNWGENTNTTINLTDRFYDIDNDTLNYNYSTNKSNVKNLTININQSSEIVTIVPDKNFYGLRSIVFSVEDNYSKAYSNNVTLNITPFNYPTNFSGPIPNITFKEDNYSKINLSNYFYDPDNDLDYSYICLEDNITIVFNNTTEIANITSFPNWYGSSMCNITAHSGLNSTTSNNFLVNITPVNDAPYFTNIKNLRRTRTYPFSYNLEAYDIENKENNLTYSLVNYTNITGNKINFSINSSNGIIKNNSKTSFVSEHKVYVSVSDGINESIENFNVVFNSLPRISYENFSTNLTTNLSKYNETTIQNVTNFTIGIEGKGKIDYSIFQGGINMSLLDIDKGINISKEHIEVNSSILKELNRSARLSFYNLSYKEPKPLRNGNKCPSDICTEISYNSSSGEYTFDITGFTYYSIHETYVPPEDNGGGGSYSSSSLETEEDNETDNEALGEETIFIFESDLENGKRVELYKGQESYINFKNKDYKMFFEEVFVSRERAIFSLGNSSFEISLNKIKDIDLNNDNNKDLRFQLNNLSYVKGRDVANINLSKIYLDGLKDDDETEEEESNTKSVWKNYKSFFYVLGTIITLIIITVIVFYIKKRKNKK